MSPGTVNSMVDEPKIEYMKLVKYHVFFSIDKRLSKNFANTKK